MTAAARVGLPAAVAGGAQIQRVRFATSHGLVIDARHRAAFRRPKEDLDLARERPLQETLRPEADDTARGRERLACPGHGAVDDDLGQRGLLPDCLRDARSVRSSRSGENE
jgi:hypothetical protein